MSIQACDIPCKASLLRNVLFSKKSSTISGVSYSLTKFHQNWQPQATALPDIGNHKTIFIYTSTVSFRLQKVECFVLLQVLYSSFRLTVKLDISPKSTTIIFLIRFDPLLHIFISSLPFSICFCFWSLWLLKKRHCFYTFSQHAFWIFSQQANTYHRFECFSIISPEIEKKT